MLDILYKWLDTIIIALIKQAKTSATFMVSSSFSSCFSIQYELHVDLWNDRFFCVV